MSSLISAELVATCNALGYFNVQENKYYADENTLETVKDLIRYLRRDDETHDIRRQLGETKVVQTDLLPLLKNYWEETELFDALLRLLVNLTTPALILWNEEVPVERIPSNQYLQVEEHLRLYKQAFADESVWAVLSTRISKILEIDYSERGDENGLIIERILILIRNILYVPADPDSERRPDNDASVHDQVLWALHQSGMLDIILYITSSIVERVYYMHILEILSLILRGQNATKLANAALQRSQTEKMRDEAELLAIRHSENHQKNSKLKQYNGARHSRFGGTFVVKSMKSISDNELICHKPLNKYDGLNFDVDKSKSKTPKNRRPIQADPAERRSAFSIRLFLREFCIEFLNGAYNTTMYHVKNRLSRSKSQQHDESYYLWAIRFFMEFNRSYKFEVKLVSETMSVETFHFVQQQMEQYFDMISSDKKKVRLWSRRLHLALLAYRELLSTIAAMSKSTDKTVSDSANVIKSNIFYVQEYRELILTLLVTYDELKMSPTYLQDLIETQHIFLKMLENYCGGKSGRVVVQGKSKTKKKSNSSKGKSSAAHTTALPQLNLNSMWDEASTQLSVVLEGMLEAPNDIVPFDALSDKSVEEQKCEAMKNIQQMLRNHDFESAITLLRASREVWPENDCFGTANMSTDEEYSALKDIFFANLQGNEPVVENNDMEEKYTDEEEEMEMEEIMISESDLKFDEFTKRLANPKIVRSCCLALANFERNTPLANHCITKLLHRIAFDCKMSMMLFQVSVFRTFQRIYEAKNLPQNKELVHFATYVMRQFFNVVQKNSSVFMEALFWKNSKDAYDISEGYGSYQEKSKAASQAWTELEEDELRRLFIEHRDSNIDEDPVDWIISNLINNTRNRRGVIKKLRQMHLLFDSKSSRKSGKSSNNWGEHEEEQLRELYEEFKDSIDPLTCIMDRLELKRPKNRIVEKLLVMGLVQDRKELQKKHRKKQDKSRHDEGTNSSESDENNTWKSSSKQTKSFNATVKRDEKKKISKHVSTRDLATTIISVANDGDFDAALEWLKESFADAAEEYENDDDDEGVPLVPILDHAVDAMEKQKFQKLLLKFGIQKPSTEQEAYWRIPSFISQDNLKEYSNMITKALDKTLQVTDEPTKSTNNSNTEDDSIFDKLKHSTQPDVAPTEDSTDISNERAVYRRKNQHIIEKIAALAKKKTHKNNPKTLEILPPTPNKKIEKQKMRRIEKIESSDDEENSLPLTDITEENNLSFMPSRIFDDEEIEGEANTTDKTNLKSEGNKNTKAFKKMKIFIESDSDSEDEHVVMKRKRSGSGSDSDNNSDNLVKKLKS